MSYASQNKRPNFGTMTAAIAVNGSIIIAIMLSPTIVGIKELPTILVGENIAIKQPPPKVIEPQPKSDSRELPPIFVPDNQGPVRPPKDQPTTGEQPTDDGPIIDGVGTGTGTGLSGGEGGGRVADPLVEPVFKSAVRDDRFIKNFQPDYPPSLLQREVEGSVKVRVLVGSDGQVKSVTILSASEPEFGRATEKKAKSSWRFKPATRDGVPVEDWQVISVRFTIT